MKKQDPPKGKLSMTKTVAPKIPFKAAQKSTSFKDAPKNAPYNPAPKPMLMNKTIQKKAGNAMIKGAMEGAAEGTQGMLMKKTIRKK
jgi:hypothetical protein